MPIRASRPLLSPRPTGALLALGSSLLLLTGCPSSEVETPYGGLELPDVTLSGDGSLPLGDGTLPDGRPIEDGEPGSDGSLPDLAAPDGEPPADGDRPDLARPDPGGELPGPLCGDGVCSPGETIEGCAADCQEPQECLEQRCSEAYYACLGRSSCVELTVCVNACGNDEACAAGCARNATEEAVDLYTALARCSLDRGCVVPPISSCQDRCGAVNEGAACQCDPGCVQRADCCDDFRALCSGPIGCGDGTCSSEETPASCPADCGLGGCFEDKCGDPLAACTADQPCAAALSCLSSCESEACVQGCLGFLPSASRQRMTALLECGSAQGCFEQGPSCGNGACEPGESAQSCPQDCPVQPDCLRDRCASPSLTCNQDPACTQGFACWQQCSSATCRQTCIQQTPQPARSKLTALVQCGFQQGCLGGGNGPTCGNGACEPGETAQSCPQDCGSTQPLCGNGSCERGETAQNCPQDCGGGGDLVQCVTQGCPAEVATCLNDAGCTGALGCVSGCAPDDFSCLQGCLGSAGLNQALIGLGLCAQREGCIDLGLPGGGGGAQCGNGSCEPGESPQSCPRDCPPSGGCGDGQCELLEYLTCPQDCGGGGGGGATCGDGRCDGLEFLTCSQDCGGGGGPQCGNNACEQGETAQSCPQDCQQGGGSAQEAFDCVRQSCPSEYQACTSDAGCDAVIDCLLQCGDVELGCLSQCALGGGGGFSQALIGIATCGSQRGCIDLGGIPLPF